MARATMAKSGSRRIDASEAERQVEQALDDEAGDPVRAVDERQDLAPSKSSTRPPGRLTGKSSTGIRTILPSSSHRRAIDSMRCRSSLAEADRDLVDDAVVEDVLDVVEARRGPGRWSMHGRRRARPRGSR